MSDYKMPDSQSAKQNGKAPIPVQTVSKPEWETLPETLTEEKDLVPNENFASIIDDLFYLNEDDLVPIEAEVISAVPQRSSNRWLRAGVVGVVLLIGLGGIAFFRRQTETPVSPAPVVEPNLPNILPVETIAVKPVSSYSTSQSYTGLVEAQRTSELSFEQSGLLRSLAVDEGAEVNQGSVIGRLDTRQLEAQRQGLIAQKDQAIATLTELENGPRQETIAATRASLEQEKAKLRELQAGPRVENIDAARSRVQDLEEQLKLARLQTQRRRDLYNQGAVSREDLDQLITAEDSLQAKINEANSNLTELKTGTRPEQIQAQLAQVQRVQSQLDELITGTRPEQIQAQQAQIRQIEAQIAELDVTLSKSILYAPFSGIISQRYLDEGTVVSPGQEVVRLVEDIRPEVRVGVAPSVISELNIGSQHLVRVGEESYTAEVLSILPEVDSATRTRTVIMALPRSAAPGTVARLEVTRTQATDGFWLPTSALVRAERGLWACYVLTPVQDSGDNLPPQTQQLERRVLEVLHTEGDRSLVRGLLQPGEKVVANGTQQFVSGQFVKTAP
ncbi:MAG: efflux RND transporter periplasmic adaptor subunit [Cyanobacteriota bacterium]|nr:efflux RND transporter periplasmic adaptor subunit [Cyanobacteriota bacterium]